MKTVPQKYSYEEWDKAIHRILGKSIKDLELEFADNLQ
jgi:hypothetical protein